MTNTKNKSTAKAFIVHKKKLLLILRDNISGINDPNTWSLPGGEIEDGETPEMALKREIKEELGITPKKILKLGRFYGPPLQEIIEKGVEIVPSKSGIV